MSFSNDTTTPAELWTWQLEDMGPFAPLDELRRHLAAAPSGVPVALVAALQQHIVTLEQKEDVHA